MTYNALPYKIMALAPFAPVPDGKFKPDFMGIDLNTIDQAIEEIAPVLYLPVSADWCKDGALTLKFNKIKDFKPKWLIKNNQYLKGIDNGKSQADSIKKPDEPIKPDENTGSKIDDILSMVETADTPVGGTDRTDNNLDVSFLMKKIYSDREFKKTESAWRGVQALVRKPEIKGHTEIDIRISSVSHNSLLHVLQTIESLPSEQVPNLVLIDLCFDNTNPDITLLEKVADFADRMMLPVAVSMRPDFFRIKTWSELNKIPYIKNYLEHVSYSKWNKIKQHPGSVWLMETCNNFPVRDPNEFEDMPVFASPVWALGILCAKSVKQTGWPMAFTKYTSINVDNLPMFSADGKNYASTEVLLSEDRIMQFAEAGITPLVGAKNKDFAFMPRQSSIAGSSIKFQMFFNRLIEALICMRNNISSDESPVKAIESLISDMFVKTADTPVEDISVVEDTRTRNADNSTVFMISFKPPLNLVSGTEKIEFSFVW